MTETTTCHEILHDGEGPRGRAVEVRSANPSAGAIAAIAAELLDAAEDRADREEGHDHRQGQVRVVEVECDGGPERFRVRCRVERRYEPESIYLEPTEAR